MGGPIFIAWSRSSGSHESVTDSKSGEWDLFHSPLYIYNTSKINRVPILGAGSREFKGIEADVGIKASTEFQDDFHNPGPRDIPCPVARLTRLSIICITTDLQ